MQSLSDGVTPDRSANSFKHCHLLVAVKASRRHCFYAHVLLASWLAASVRGD